MPPPIVDRQHPLAPDPSHGSSPAGNVTPVSSPPNSPRLSPYFRSPHLSISRAATRRSQLSSEEDDGPHPGTRWYPDPNKASRWQIRYRDDGNKIRESMVFEVLPPEGGVEDFIEPQDEEVEHLAREFRDKSYLNGNGSESESTSIVVQQGDRKDFINANTTIALFGSANTSIFQASTPQGVGSFSRMSLCDEHPADFVKPISRNSDGSSDPSPNSGLKKVVLDMKLDLKRHISASEKMAQEKSIPEESISTPLSTVSLLPGAFTNSACSNPNYISLPVDVETLLQLSDTSRRIISSGVDMHMDDVASLSNLLMQWIQDEILGMFEVPLLTIIDARLDKFVKALCDMKLSIQCESDPDFKDLITKAIGLNRMWLKKYGTRFTDIEAIREKNFAEGGRFTKIVLDPHSKAVIPAWKVSTPQTVMRESDEERLFKVGEWWINHVCAYRDGMVTTPNVPFAKDSLGRVTNISLLQGTEVDGKLLNETFFAAEGSLKDIGGSLLSQVGKDVRVLRGYLLASKHAPSAGIRYDGVYKIQQFGIKYNAERGCHRVELRLRRRAVHRLDVQKDMTALMDIPSASQLDDWIIFQNIENEVVKSSHDKRTYEAWNAYKREQERRRASFQRGAALAGEGYDPIFQDPKLVGI